MSGGRSAPRCRLEKPIVTRSRRFGHTWTTRTFCVRAPPLVSRWAKRHRPSSWGPSGIRSAGGWTRAGPPSDAGLRSLRNRSPRNASVACLGRDDRFARGTVRRPRAHLHASCAVSSLTGVSSQSTRNEQARWRGSTESVGWAPCSAVGRSERPQLAPQRHSPRLRVMSHAAEYRVHRAKNPRRPSPRTRKAPEVCLPGVSVERAGWLGEPPRCGLTKS